VGGKALGWAWGESKGSPNDKRRRYSKWTRFSNRGFTTPRGTNWESSKSLQKNWKGGGGGKKENLHEMERAIRGIIIKKNLKIAGEDKELNPRWQEPDERGGKINSRDSFEPIR